MALSTVTKLGLVALLATSACGGDDGDDAPPGVTPPPACDFTEANDATNDQASAAEMTNISDVGTSGRALCGKVDASHRTNTTIDSDHYRITVGSEALLVHFAGGDGSDALPDFTLRIFDTSTPPVLLAEKTVNPAIADHAAFLADLAPGDYDVVVTATGNADIATSVDYKVQFLPDDPMRCPKSTDAATYNEANDGATNTGNDGFTINWSDDPAIVAAAGPAEASGISLDPTTKAHITGMMGATDAADEYLDQDSYSFTTGKDTNEMSIRVDWAGAGADLDYVVIEDGQTVLTQESDTSDTSGDEFATFALKPSTSYVVWVGAHDGSGSLPMAYDVSLCGSGFKY